MFLYFKALLIRNDLMNDSTETGSKNHKVYGNFKNYKQDSSAG
jgi:hypothetical protein